MKRRIFTSAVLTLTGLLAVAMEGTAMAAEAGTTITTQAGVTMLNARDMVFQPGSETARVQIHFADADRIQFGGPGELFVTRANGNRVAYRPDAYQMINDKMKPVTVSFTKEGRGRVRLNFGKFDQNAPLILRRAASTT